MNLLSKQTEALQIELARIYQYMERTVSVCSNTFNEGKLKDLIMRELIEFWKLETMNHQSITGDMKLYRLAKAYMHAMELDIKRGEKEYYFQIFTIPDFTIDDESKMNIKREIHKEGITQLALHQFPTVIELDAGQTLTINMGIQTFILTLAETYFSIDELLTVTKKEIMKFEQKMLQKRKDL